MAVAKIRGGLFSVEAIGTLGDVMTFSKRKSGQQVRYQKKQKDANTEAQNIVRDNFKKGVTLWNSMPQSEKDYWKQIEVKGYANV